ncbi:MAG: hypothetical protein ACI89L_000528 [Phycisphaerales bacterium]|jgi:hypothetical protein
MTVHATDRQPETLRDAAPTAGPGEGVAARKPVAQRAGGFVGSQWRRRGPLLILAAIGLTVSVTWGVLHVGARMRAAPDWWLTLPANDPAIMQTALDVENGISGELTKRRDLTEQDLPRVGAVRASEPWAVRLESEQASAWLTERLPKWAAAEGWLSDWPEELAELRLNFDGATIRLGARIRSGEQADGSYMSATLTPQFRADGTVWLIAESVAIGTLPLPPGWVFSKSPDKAGSVLPEEFQGDDLEEIFKVFAGDHPAPDPLIRLGDGRRVRLVGIRPEEEGTVLLIFRTEYVERG